MRLIDIAEYDVKEAEIQWTTYGVRTVTINRRKTKDLPTIDAVPVVRCKDCKECYFASNRVPTEQSYVCGKHGIDVSPEWFCADGERD